MSNILYFNDSVACGQLPALIEIQLGYDQN